MTRDYRRFFNPVVSAVATADVSDEHPDVAGPASVRFGDRRATPVYEFDEDLILAVNVAMATRRPLLVAGDPGTGKSSLADAVARELERPLYSIVVTSRTDASDLLFRFDAVRRLGDAHVNQLATDEKYLDPGVLWWGFNRQSARELVPDPQADRPGPGAVVLIDEIDKAEPDVPNSLLVPLGSFTFDAPGRKVTALEPPPVVVITTNRERDLPPAFVRRCIGVTIAPPDRPKLERIVKAHFPGASADLKLAAIDVFLTERDNTDSKLVSRPGTAELLDLVAALSELSANVHAGDWKASLERVLLLTVRKTTHRGGA